MAAIELALGLGLVSHIHHRMEQLAAIELALELELANHIHHKIVRIHHKLGLAALAERARQRKSTTPGSREW